MLRRAGGYVALRKESVDRNVKHNDLNVISIHVALRKESVDRNKKSSVTSVPKFSSLSARRAWIEMYYDARQLVRDWRRSPQGERG